jgi:uncharacterized protein (TIRG00374 family)
MKQRLKKTIKVLLPIALGAFVLYWIYKDFDFARVREVLFSGMNWGWMLFSLLFGVLSPLFRGLRWRQTLLPLGENPKKSHCADAVFMSYAASLVVPRVGEVSRCAALSRYDGVSFSRSLGTVVTERVIDMLCVALMTVVVFLIQMPVFMQFFEETGAKIPSVIHLFGTVWFYIVLFFVVGICILAYYLVRTLSFFDKVKGMALDIRAGILSLKKVQNLPLFLFYTVMIWLCYFLHFYITFFCFPFTGELGALPALVMFVAGTFGVLVPTPNGAGSWHFAVITMMMLYGVSADDAGIFALLVHAIQTLEVVLLGIWGWLHLSFSAGNYRKSSAA